MSEKPKLSSESVRPLEIPHDITLEDFTLRLEQARRQPVGQTLFSSVRGDRFIGKQGAESSLLDASLLIMFRLLDDHIEARDADPQGVVLGAVSRSEPDIEGVQTVVEHMDLGGGIGVQIERDIYSPHASTNQAARVDRLVVTTELPVAEQTAA